MTDNTISRRAAIDAAIAAVDDWDGCTNIGRQKRIEKYINALPPAQQWIPCDRGEPDENMECWVAVKTTYALYRGNFTKRYGERRDKGFITSGGFMWWNTALAWMPIYEPAPYCRKWGQDKELNPADVAPVRHGRWIGCDTQCGIACSVCGTPVDDFCHSIDYIDLAYKPKYCPNCGARMDEGSGGDGQI